MSILLFDLERTMRILSGHKAPVLSLAYSPDSTTLASSDSAGKVEFWDVGTGKTRAIIGFQVALMGPIVSLRFAPSGRYLAAGATSVVRVLDRETNTWTGFELSRGGSIVTAFSRDSSRLFIAGYLESTLDELALTTDDSNARPRTLEKSQPRWDGPEFGPLWSGVLALTASPCAEILAAGRDRQSRGSVILWDLVEQRFLRNLPGHRRPVYAVAFSPNGTLLASGSRDQTVRLWDVDTGKELAVMEGHRSTVLAVGFTPDGRTIASASEDGAIRLWDAATGRELAAYDWKIGQVRSVVLAPDGMTAAAAGSNGAVMIWDLD
jgi:WD40 repeat protein